MLIYNCMYNYVLPESCPMQCVLCTNKIIMKDAKE